MRFYRMPLPVQWYYGEMAVTNFSHFTDTLFLTFDDGPDPEITPKVLEILDRFGIKATFFCIGENVVKYPEVFQSIILAGHQVGNHTHNHLKGIKTPDHEYYLNVIQANEFIHSGLFRPPYGRIRKSQIGLLHPEFRIVLWSLLSWDFDPSLQPASCLRNTIKHTKGGDVIVFHDSQKASRSMLFTLPAYIEYCLQKNFKFGIIE